MGKRQDFDYLQGRVGQAPVTIAARGQILPPPPTASHVEAAGREWIKMLLLAIVVLEEDMVLRSLLTCLSGLYAWPSRLFSLEVALHNGRRI
jgi:hypothetical protein